jgi:hypothetical protein
MKPLSEILTALIAIAEELMRKPVQHAVAYLPPHYAAIAAEVRRVHALPADGTRATRAGIVMCEALEGFDATGADRWQMLVGATLPILRNEAWISLRNERAQVEESRR